MNSPQGTEPDRAERNRASQGVTCPPETQGLATEAAFGKLKFARPTHLEQRTLKGQSFWYVVEQGGVVTRFPHTTTGTPKTETVLDLSKGTFSEDDGAGNEAGMFSIAFHPNFEAKGKRGFGELFISYTGKVNAGPTEIESRISRFKSKDNGKSFDAASEEVLLRIVQPFTNHNGGALAFGPDGFLYAGYGDGGSAGDPFKNGQNLGNTAGCKTGVDQCALLAKILRIDVDVDFKASKPYAIPKDNPFKSGDLCSTRSEEQDESVKAECPEIFAYGIRNPWKFSFDPATGQLWLGDVGQNTQEEVDIVENGGNYGWSVREGNLCFDPAKNCPDKGGKGTDGKKFKTPVATYGTNVGRSITGGHVYRGTEMPSMVGQYVFADIASGRFLATLSKTKTTFATRIAAAGTVQPVAFGVAADGELYTLDFAKGAIHKVVQGVCTDGSVPPPPKEYLFLSRDGVGTEEEASAYYKSILPAAQAKSLTLDAWIKDRFAKQKAVSVFFRNTADLGFWREMTCSQSIGRGFGGCWVRNWKNHDDKDTGKKDLGTVAMDVSPEGFTRFFVFAPGGKISTKAVLDSEKEKFVPRLCTPCHNGLYLGPASSGNMVAVFREFEPSLFELPPGATDKDKKAAEEGWFDLNQAVKSANLALQAEGEGGPTGIDHAVEAINDYIDDIYPKDKPPAIDVRAAAHIPASWKVGSAAQKKLQAELWTKAINPTCMGCHRTNTHNFAQFSVFQQLGPDASGSSVLQKYLAMDPKDGKQPLAIMPQSELLFKNLLADEAAVEAIKAWLGAVRGSRGP